MDCLNITQSIKIIKTYYKKGDSGTATYRALRGGYGLYNRLYNTQAIGKIVKKFEETGVGKNIDRPVRHRFARSTENIAIVSESIAEDPNVSISRLPQELGQSRRHFMAYFAFRSTPTFI